MKRPFWQRTHRPVIAVCVLSVAGVAAWSGLTGPASSQNEGLWLAENHVTTTTTTAAPPSSSTPTPEQIIALARSPLGAQVRGVVDTVTDRQVPAQRIGQRAVGLDGPIGADVDGIEATATLSPGAQVQKALAGGWPDPLDGLDDAAMAGALGLAALAVIAVVKR